MQQPGERAVTSLLPVALSPQRVTLTRGGVTRQIIQSAGSTIGRIQSGVALQL